MTTYSVLLSKTVLLAGEVLVEAESIEEAVEQIRSGLEAWQADPDGESIVGNPWSILGDTDPGADSDHRIMTLGLASDGPDPIPLLEDIAVSDTDGLANSERDVRSAVRYALGQGGVAPGHDVFRLTHIYTGKAERIAYVEARSEEEAMMIAKGEAQHGDHEWTYLPEGFVVLRDGPDEYEVTPAVSPGPVTTH